MFDNKNGRKRLWIGRDTFKTEILVPEVKSYLEGFMCEVAGAKLCSLREIC